MAINEDVGRFLVDLAGEISSKFSQGIQNASQRFSAQLTNLSTAVSAQGVSQVVGLFDGDSSKYQDWIKSLEKYTLLSGGNGAKTKLLAYQTSRGAVSDYIHHYMTEHPDNTWEQLKGELNVHFAEVNDQHHAFTMLCKAQQHKAETVQVYAERLYALVQDAFEKTNKALVESQLIGFFIDGLYYDFLCMKVL